MLLGSALFRSAFTCILGDRKDGDLCPGKVAFFCLLLLGLILILTWVSLDFFFFLDVSFYPCRSRLVVIITVILFFQSAGLSTKDNLGVRNRMLHQHTDLVASSKICRLYKNPSDVLRL